MCDLFSWQIFTYVNYDYLFFFIFKCWLKDVILHGTSENYNSTNKSQLFSEKKSEWWWNGFENINCRLHICRWERRNIGKIAIEEIDLPKRHCLKTVYYFNNLNNIKWLTTSVSLTKILFYKYTSMKNETYYTMKLKEILLQNYTFLNH